MSETSQLTVQALAKKTLFTPDQRKKVEGSIQQLEFMLKDPVTKEASHVAPDVEMIEACLVRDQAMLQTGIPEEFSTSEKNRLNHLRQELERRMQHDMPTFDEMERPLPVNIDKHMAWEKLHKKEILAWKTVCRTLDPLNDNSNFTSIARLRSHTPAKGDPRKYWQGFDAVNWDLSIEDELADNLDDDMYKGFLEKRILGWSRTNIQKAMQMSDQFYAACLEKLKRSYSSAQTDELDATPDEARQPEVPATVKNLKVALGLALEEKRELAWPLNELAPLNLSLYRLCKMTKITDSVMRSRIKNSNFKESEIALIEKTITQERQRQAAELTKKPEPQGYVASIAAQVTSRQPEEEKEDVELESKEYAPTL